ncbi:MAG: GAF domain-containing protein [Syntrophobacteraceae bacterium]|jgi:two-component system NtrC family sensor kinase
MKQTSKKTSGGITREKLLTSILKINQLLALPVSIDNVLSAIVEESQRIFDFTRVAIFIINKEARLLERKYLIGFVPIEVEKTMNRPPHLDKHPCSETLVANTGQTVYIPDRLNDPRITPIDLKMDLFWKRVSTIGAPLRIEQDIIGVLEGDTTDRPLHLSPQEIDLFTFFANQASIIIENARLQDQNRKKIQQLLLLQEVTKKSSLTFDVNELIDNIAISALRLTNARSCLVFMCNENGKYLKQVAGSGEPVLENELVGLGEGIVGDVATAGLPRIIHDARKESGSSDPHARSQLVVPIATDNKVKGVISAYSDRISAFSKSDLEILSIMASHAAVLFQNAALYEQLSMEKDRAENILESSYDGILTLSGTGVIQSVNRRTEQLFEIEKKSMVGKSISEIENDNVEKVLDMALRKRLPYGRFESGFVRQSGEDSILEIAISPLKRVAGADAEWMILFRDITESKKSEEVIRRMERLSALGEFSAGIAHEIRNPLSAIKLNLQMLSKRMDREPESLEKISDSLEGIVRIDKLIRSVLNFARPTMPRFKKDSVQRVLRETVDVMKLHLKRKKISVSVDIAPTVPPISFDEDQIRQVFLNLLSNAMEAMPDGGKIKITGSMNGNASGKNGLFRLIISDNGIGIRREVVPKIFDPFFTTKPEGTGLGLSIVHKILEQHRAIVEVESFIGVGTVFKLTFPVDSVEAEDVST